MPKWRMTKDNCDDIGFAYACLVSGVISFEEFKTWLYLVVEQDGDVPNYVWDAIDLTQKFDFLPLKIMGFTPHWDHSLDEADALLGIGYRRGDDFTCDAMGQDAALKILRDNPQIEDRFRTTFPFIDLA